MHTHCYPGTTGGLKASMADAFGYFAAKWGGIWHDPETIRHQETSTITGESYMSQPNLCLGQLASLKASILLC